MSVSEKTSNDEFLFNMMPNKIDRLDVVNQGESLLSDLSFPTTFPYKEIKEALEGLSASPTNLDIRNLLKENLNLTLNIQANLLNKLELQNLKPKELLGLPSPRNMGQAQNSQQNLRANNVSPHPASKSSGGLGSKTTSSVKIFGSSSTPYVAEKKKETKGHGAVGAEASKPRDKFTSTMLRQMIRETNPGPEENDLLHTELSKLGFSAFSDYKEPLGFESTQSSNTETMKSGKRSVTPSGTGGQVPKKSLNSSFNLSEASGGAGPVPGRATIHHNVAEQSTKIKPTHVKQKSERSLTPTQKKPDAKNQPRPELYDSLSSTNLPGNTSRTTSKERESYIQTNRNSSRSPFRGFNDDESKRGRDPKQESRPSTKFVAPSGKNVGSRASEISLIKQKFKISEQFSAVLEGIKSDSLEVVDLTCADIGDVGLSHLCEYLVDNSKVKTLKLVKNKLTDEGVAVLFKALENNESIYNVNLTLNMLSEKSVEAFYKLCQKNKTIKFIYFSQNNVFSTKIKDLLKDLKNSGVTVYL